MAWRHDIQTLNSYARLIWVCTHSPKRSALSNAHALSENATFRSFCRVWVQSMTSVIAAHSCQQLTMGKQARACQGKIFFSRSLAADYTANGFKHSRPAWPFLRSRTQSGDLAPHPFRGSAKPPLCRLTPLFNWREVRRGFRERAQYPAIQIYRPARSSTKRSCGGQLQPCRHWPASAQKPRQGAGPHTARAIGSTTRLA